MKFTILLTGPVTDFASFAIYCRSLKNHSRVSRVVVVSNSALSEIDGIETFVLPQLDVNPNVYARNIDNQVHNIAFGLALIKGAVVRVRTDLRFQNLSALLDVSSIALSEGKVVIDTCVSHNPWINFYLSDFLTIGTVDRLRSIFNLDRVQAWNGALYETKGRVWKVSCGNCFLQPRGVFAEYLIWASWAYTSVGQLQPVQMGQVSLSTEKALLFLDEFIQTVDRKTYFFPSKRFLISSNPKSFSRLVFFMTPLYGIVRKVYDCF